MGLMTSRFALAAIGLTLMLAVPAAAQQVTKIDSGDTIVVDGVGKVRLIGIRSVDESPLGVAPNQRAKPGTAWCSSIPRPSTARKPRPRAAARSGVSSGT